MNEITREELTAAQVTLLIATGDEWKKPLLRSSERKTVEWLRAQGLVERRSQKQYGVRFYEYRRTPAGRALVASQQPAVDLREVEDGMYMVEPAPLVCVWCHQRPAVTSAGECQACATYHAGDDDMTYESAPDTERELLRAEVTRLRAENVSLKLELLAREQVEAQIETEFTRVKAFTSQITARLQALEAENARMKTALAKIAYATRDNAPVIQAIAQHALEGDGA